MAFIQYLTQIHLDHGAVRLLPGECQRVGMRKSLIVTDAGVRAAGVLAQAVAALGDLPLRSSGNTTTYLRDVAQVRDGFQPQTNIVRQDGARADASSIDNTVSSESTAFCASSAVSMSTSARAL